MQPLGMWTMRSASTSTLFSGGHALATSPDTSIRDDVDEEERHRQLHHLQMRTLVTSVLQLCQSWTSGNMASNLGGAQAPLECERIWPSPTAWSRSALPPDCYPGVSPSHCAATPLREATVVGCVPRRQCVFFAHIKQVSLQWRCRDGRVAWSSTRSPC